MNIVREVERGSKYIFIQTLCIQDKPDEYGEVCVLYQDLNSKRTLLCDYLSFVAPGRFIGVGNADEVKTPRECEWVGDKELYEELTKFKIMTDRRYGVPGVFITVEGIKPIHLCHDTWEVAVKIE